MSEDLIKTNSISVGCLFSNKRIHIDSVVHAKNTGKHQSIITDDAKRTYTYPFSVSHISKTFPLKDFISLGAGEIVSLDYWDEAGRDTFDCKEIVIHGISYFFSKINTRILIKLRKRLKKLKCRECRKSKCLLSQMMENVKHAKLNKILLKKI